MQAKGGPSKGKGRREAGPPDATVDGELPLRHDRRRRWRLAFANLGIGSNAEESEHRGR